MVMRTMRVHLHRRGYDRICARCSMAGDLGVLLAGSVMQRYMWLATVPVSTLGMGAYRR